MLTTNNRSESPKASPLENLLLLPRLIIFLQKRIKCDLLSTAAGKGKDKDNPVAGHGGS
jgi:hypothetical protein